MFNSFVIQESHYVRTFSDINVSKNCKGNYSYKHVKYRCVKVAVICALKIWWKSTENNKNIQLIFDY